VVTTKAWTVASISSGGSEEHATPKESTHARRSISRSFTRLSFRKVFILGIIPTIYIIPAKMGSLEID